MKFPTQTAKELWESDFHKTLKILETSGKDMGKKLFKLTFVLIFLFIFLLIYYLFIFLLIYYFFYLFDLFRKEFLFINSLYLNTQIIFN